VFGAFVDLERQDGRSCVGRHDGDAVGSDEPAEHIACHRVGEPELDRRMLAVIAPVQGADGPRGVDAVPHIGGRSCCSSGAETLVTEWAQTVCLLGTTWRLSG
jgi:hypothetical protein